MHVITGLSNTEGEEETFRKTSRHISKSCSHIHPGTRLHISLIRPRAAGSLGGGAEQIQKVGPIIYM